MNIKSFLASILTGLLLAVWGTPYATAPTPTDPQDSICDYLPWWPGC